MEIIALLRDAGGKVVGPSEALIDLSESPLAGYEGGHHVPAGLDAEWEIDRSTITLLDQIGARRGSSKAMPLKLHPTSAGFARAASLANPWEVMTCLGSGMS